MPMLDAYIPEGALPAEAERPAQFLEWARNTGLLRVTGIAYQCRHDSYQQWLTDRSPQQQSDLPTPSPPD
jgi:hypothetical protein